MPDQFTAFGVISLINCITCLAIGTFLYIKNKTNPINVAYCAFDVCIAFYAFFYFLWQSSSDPQLGIMFFKWCIVGVVLINSAFVHFSFVVLYLDKKLKKQLLLVHLINVFFCYAALKLFYIDWQVKYSYGLWPIPSRFFDIYLVWWFSQVIGCFFLIYKEGVLKAKGKEKKQFLWIFWATLIAYAGGATNWFVWYGVNFPPYLNSGIAIYTIVLAYAIFRHQLLGIDVIIKKTIIFAGIFATAVFLIAFPFALLQALVGQVIGPPKPFILMALGIVTAVLIYRPVELFLVNITDKYLFQKKEDMRLILKKLADQVVRIHSSKQLGQTVLETLKTTIRPESSAIWVQSDNGDYVMLECYGLKMAETMCIKKNDLLVTFFSRFKGVINLTDPKMQVGLPIEVMIQLNRMKAVLILLLLQDDELVGLLFLGKKMSDEEYTAEELEYLPTIANQIAVGLNFAKAIERQKNMLMDYAQQSKLATLGTLTAGIGHEINNPVNNISGCVSMLQLNLKRGVYDILNKDDFAHEVQEVLSMVADNTQRIASIIRRLSLFSRRPKDFKTSDVSPITVIEDALANVKSQLDQSGITVEKKYPAHISSMQIDFGSVSQSLVAIFINGIQAMGTSGGFTVGITPAVAGFVGIYIEDTGSGIKKEHLEKIFDPFFTTKDSVEPSLKGEQGTGLGLYIVQLLIQMNGGRIEVDSVVGQGTTFHLYFPTQSI